MLDLGLLPFSIAIQKFKTKIFMMSHTYVLDAGISVFDAANSHGY
jgi:hypothetical protein